MCTHKYIHYKNGKYLCTECERTIDVKGYRCADEPGLFARISKVSAAKIVISTIEEMFAATVHEFDLPSGDVTKPQGETLIECEKKLTEVLKEYIHNNML